MDFSRNSNGGWGHDLLIVALAMLILIVALRGL